MRRGILAAGNWLIDRVKIIDTWPEQGMLANIRSEATGTGGSPYNLLVDLARLEVGIPLEGLGVVGRDADGERILADMRRLGIDSSRMERTDRAPTSYTDVMTEASSGARTFFHCRGANALLGPEHFEKVATDARIFHLGYLLLLDRLDAPDSQYGVAAARVLDSMRRLGCRTSVDVVSEASDRFRNIVRPCLPYIDYLVVNEIEAGESTGERIRRPDRTLDGRALVAAARALVVGGVGEVVVIHFPEGALALPRGGRHVFVPSFPVRTEEIRGTVGAGDAFCAGVLYALHEGWPLEKALALAHAGARFNLMDPTSTGGAVPLAEMESYMSRTQPRDFLPAGL